MKQDSIINIQVPQRIPGLLRVINKGNKGDNITCPVRSDHPAICCYHRRREIDPTDGVKEHEKNILCRHYRLFGVFLEVAVGRERKR